MVNGVSAIPISTPPVRDACDGMLREFIVGPENQIVLQAVSSIQERSRQYNPLVFCGPTGSGKSFLANGLAESAETSFGRMVATTGADFARNYANAVDTNAVDDLRAWYAGADLFLLDDLESIGPKHAAQRELSLALDELIAADSQIILTCRRVPSQLNTIGTALVSRLMSGLVVHFQLPRLAARREIIKRLSSTLRIDLPGEAVDLLAGTEGMSPSHLQTVPQLRHALLQLASGQETVDSKVIASYLDQHARQHTPTLRSISTIVCQYYRLKSNDLRGPARQRHLVQARGMAMYLARRLTNKSLAQVGDYFGGRDHTTVLHACRRTEQLIGNEAESQQAADELIAQITNIKDPSIPVAT